jgi:hypothetical protein
MKRTYQRSLLAAAIASLIALPVWSADPVTEQAPLIDESQVQEMQPAPQANDPGLTESAPDLQPEQGPTMGQDDPQTASSDNPVLQLTPDELKNMEVVDPVGEKVGKVDSIIRSREGGSEIQAVISSGGVLGIGAKEVAVPIDSLELSDDKLQIRTTQEELKSREDYEPNAYVEVEPTDQPLSEFSAFEPVPEEKIPSPDAPMTMPDEQGAPAPGGETPAAPEGQY